MMCKLVKGSNCQGWRYLIYGVILVCVSFFYSEDNGVFRAVRKEGMGVSQGVLANEKDPEKQGKLKSTSLPHGRTEPLNLSEAAGTYTRINATKALNLRETVADDLSVYENSDIERYFVIDEEIKSLLNQREAIYEENRTLTASELVDLHSVKDSENYPFAVKNEAQLVLRELAIEHRIPHECAEAVTAGCLVILERAQAGSMPFECQYPYNNQECEKAFARFWES